MSVEDVIAARVRQQRENDLKSWWHSVPNKLRHYDLEELLESNMDGKLTLVNKNSIVKYMSDPSQFLILQGGSGLGKSLLGVELCGHLLSTGKARTALFVDSPSFFDQISFRYSESDPISHLAAPDVLMLDDVGAGTSEMSATRKTGMWSLVNRRWQAGKLTLMTTNMPIKAEGLRGVDEGAVGLSEWFGESAWDRISSDLTLVKFRGESARRQPRPSTTMRKASDRSEGR